MPYQSIFGQGQGQAPPARGGLDFSSGFQPGQYAKINAQIAASQPSPQVSTPRPSFFNKIAGGLANFATGNQKGQKAADASLNDAQQKLMKAVQDQSLPIDRRNSAFRALTGLNDPTAAAQNTQQTKQMTSPGTFGKGLLNMADTATGHVATQANKNIIQPALHPDKYTQTNVLANQKAAQDAAASGKLTPQTQALLKRVQSPGAKNQIYKMVADNKTSDAEVQNTILKQLQQEDAQNKKAAGSALTLASLGVGAGEVAGLNSAKSFIAPVLANAAAGYAGTVGNNLYDHPQASFKDLQKGAPQNAAIAGGLTALGPVLGKAREATNVVRGRDSEVGSLLTNSATQKLIKTGQQAPEEQKLLTAGSTVLGDNKGIMLPPAESKVATLGTDVGEHVTTSGASVGSPSIEGPATRGRRPATTTPYGYTQEVQNTLNKVEQARTAGNSKQALNEMSSIFSPAHGETANAVKSDLRASMGEVTAQRAQADIANADRTKFFGKQKAGENLNFIQKIESGVPQGNAKLDQHATFFKDWFNKDLSLAKEVKPTTEGLPNYFAHSGMWKNPGEVEAWTKKFMNPSLTGNPGAVNERVFPTVYDAIKGGMVPKETNPMTLALNNRAQLVKAIQMQNFIDAQLAKGVDPAIVHAFADRVMEQGFKDSAIFQTAKQAGFAINNLQLGLSGFHLTGTAINSQVSELSNAINYLASGHPIKSAESAIKGLVPGGATGDYLNTGRKLRSAFAAGDESNKFVKYAKMANLDLGSQPTFRTNGLQKSIQEFQNGHKVSATLLAPFRAVSSFSKPLMEWWVPNMKAGAFQRGMETELAKLGKGAGEADIQRAAQRVGDSIDNRFGKVNMDNLFWNQKVKDSMGVLMRSPGWNIGTVREIGGGATDLLRPSTYKAIAKGQGISNRSAYTLSLAAGTALMGGTLQYMFTGHWPTEVKDFFYPKTGQTDKNGNPERVSMPTYAKDVFSFAHNPVQTVSNKMSPVLSLGNQVRTNKNYFGDNVRNTNDSLLTQAKQVGGYVGKNVMPFSISNTSKRIDQGVGAKAQNFFGLTTAPGYITKTPLEQNIQSALNHAMGTKSRTPEEVATANQKTQAAQATGVPQIERQLSLLMKVDRPAAARILNGATPKDIQSLSPSLLDEIRKTSAYTSLSKSDTTKQATRDASNSLLQKLGGDKQALYNQKKADIKASAAAKRAKK